MRYRKTPARRRGRRYRLASAFPRRRYLPAAAAVSFLSPPLSAVFFPSPSPAILSTLYLLTVRWILLSLPRPPHASSYNVVLRLLFIPPLLVHPPYQYTYPVLLLLPSPFHSFPSDAVTGVAPAPNSYKIDGQEPHRERGWRVYPLQLLAASLPSIRPSFTHTGMRFAHTLVRGRRGEEEVGGTEQKRNGDARKGRRDEGRKGLRGRERETRGRKRRSVGERERRSCARSGGGKDAGAQDAGRRCSTTLHWQLHPSHTRYEPCSRATLHRDTRRTIVASAPTGGTSSSSIFVDVRPLGVCLASPRVERD